MILISICAIVFYILVKLQQRTNSKYKYKSPFKEFYESKLPRKLRGRGRKIVSREPKSRVIQQAGMKTKFDKTFFDGKDF